eukprot:5558252-Amphidinium_carterae.3
MCIFFCLGSSLFLSRGLFSGCWRPAAGWLLCLLCVEGQQVRQIFTDLSGDGMARILVSEGQDE